METGNIRALEEQPKDKNLLLHEERAFKKKGAIPPLLLL